jgi:hypothetical protein
LNETEVFKKLCECDVKEYIPLASEKRKVGSTVIEIAQNAVRGGGSCAMEVTTKRKAANSGPVRGVANSIAEACGARQQ